MKKLLSIALSLSVMILAISCGDDDGGDSATPTPADPTFSAPTVSTSSSIIEVDGGAAGSASFTVSVDADLTATWTAVGNNVTVATASGSVDGGTITVDFTADDDAGAASITLTVTDSESQSATAIAVISIAGAEVVIPDAATFTVTDNTELRGPDEDNVTEYPQTTVTGVINQDFTFTNDVVWVLNGRVVVGAGATLTIEAGTIIKANEGQGANSSVLIVARDADIMANGTAAEPIIFTSIQDGINLPGLAYFDGSAIQNSGDGFTSTLPIEETIGLWGGVVILGNAPISSSGGDENQIEGVPVSDTNGLYGGSDAADNSGSFIYVSIRFTGTQLAPGSELQGLTLGGVGSGTTISYVESLNSADDGIEIFGGSVDVSNFIVYAPDDDGYDLDEGYSGTISNFLYVASPGSAGGFSFDSDHGFELDGPEAALDGQFKMINGAVQGGDTDEYADLRDGLQADLENIYFFGFTDGNQFEIDSDASAANFNAGGATGIVIAGLEFLDTTSDGVAVTLDALYGESGTDGTLEAANQAIFNDGASVVATPTVGANLDAFLSGWSYSAILTNNFEAFTSIQ